MGKKKFLMGGSLVPLGLDTHMPMEEWEKSFEQMHRMGLNSFRMFISWSRVERKEGILDFSQPDYAFSLAEKYKLNVLVNVGGLFNNLQGYTAPAWLFHNYPVSKRISNPLQETQYNNPDMQICSDDPVYKEKAFDFIRKTVNRYKDHPMLESWSVWNEPHGDPCYCSCTLEKFRVWLKKKYENDLDLLNEKWGALFPVDFPSWEDVRPIYVPGNVPRNQVMAMDFLTFCKKNYIHTFNEICSLVHELDPNHTTTFNMQGIHGCDMSDFHVKTAGISAYYEYFRDPRTVYMWTNLYMRSARVGLSPEEKVRIIETDSGPRPDNDDRPGCQKHNGVCDWSMVAMGAEQILAWIYRTRLDGGHSLQSQLCDFYGDDTPRLKEFSARAKIIRKNEDLILSSRPFSGDIGIWWDVSMLHYGKVGKHISPKEIPFISHDNAMMAALDCGYQAEFVNDKMVLSGEVNRFKSILVPFRPYMTQMLADKLREYVENGGLLIAESQFALKDEYFGQTWKPTPGGLSDVFGVDVHDMLLFKKDKDFIKLANGEKFSAYRYRMVMRPEADTEILATFADGAPAITAHKYGKGRAIFIGALVTTEYHPASPLRQFLAEEWKAHGMEALFQVPGAEDVGIYPVTKDGQHFSMLYVINYSEEERTVSLIPDKTRLQKKLFRDLISKKEYILPCRVTLAPLQNLILASEE